MQWLQQAQTDNEANLESTVRYFSLDESMLRIRRLVVHSDDKILQMLNPSID